MATERLLRPVSIVPLVVFRIAFGILMCVSAARFWANGWIEALYVAPPFHFSYLGFAWVPQIGVGLYAVYAALMALAVLIALGWGYRAAAVGYFVLFTYVQLLDNAYYLNHYYFVSLVSFLLIWLPAHGAFSIDSWRNPALRRDSAPCWMVLALRLQLGMVYFFAGVAKINPDWLLEGLPLRLWLQAHTAFPLIGGWFDERWFALAMSWGGAAFDLTSAFWLSWRRSRPWAYAAVVAFHLMTAALFPIGMFPYIMIVATLTFFEAEDWAALARRVGWRGVISAPPSERAASAAPTWRHGLLIGFFAVQVALPLRYLLYPGDILWTQDAFRFSWRVMLVESAGMATFTLRDPASGRSTGVRCCRSHGLCGDGARQVMHWVGELSDALAPALITDDSPFLLANRAFYTDLSEC